MTGVKLFEPSNNTIQYCSLGSGSKGNGTLIASGDCIILVDCGFSVKESLRRLALKGVLPEQLSAILVTHEHFDHLSGVAALSNKYSIPVWINRGTSLHPKCDSIKNVKLFNTHDAFKLGTFNVQPVAVPHDSREASQFVFSVNSLSIGLLTDVGHITKHIIDAYNQCDVLLLEFNYDPKMLSQGPYPYSLKERVSGSLGHLSNQQALEMLESVDLRKMHQLVVMHISEKNNSVELIVKTLNKLSLTSSDYFIANQAEGFDWHALIN